jgi:hypothetical protein
MHVLITCSSHDSVSTIAFHLQQLGATVHYCITARDVRNIFGTDRLDQYRIIIITPIHWNIGPTQLTLARRFKNHFDGPILGISEIAEGRENLAQGGCTEVVSSDSEACERITAHLETNRKT